MSGTGLFCVFEGLDGSGKSTLLEHTAARLRSHPALRSKATGLTILKEPTDMPEGLEIRRRLKESTDADPSAWLEYFQSDRRRNVEVNIRPGLAAGRVLIQDRYFYSTAAYQGVDAPDDSGEKDDGFTPEEIIADSRRRGFPIPGLLFFLEISPEVALDRIDRGRAGRETFETLDRLRAIAERYERILPPETRRLDASLSPEELTEQAAALILENL